MVTNPAPGGPLSAEFGSTPNQIHLNKLIKVFRITLKQQEGVLQEG